MMVLNENPKNFFTDIEQAAFCPANIVPGIEFSADKMLQGRTFSYTDTQRYRIGANFAQLPVNRPVSPVANDQQDGYMAYKNPPGCVNYKPNSLDRNNPQEAPMPCYPGMRYPGGTVQRSVLEKTDDYSQARTRYRSLPDAEKARLVTDDCSLFELTGRPVQLTQGDYANLKITTREDLPRAEQKEGNDMRIGHGYDVHRLVEDRKLILGGVEVPFEKGLLGHSDADVLTHAVMDALLGACALGDIGHLFPDSDPAYAGADSLRLLDEVVSRLRQRGYRVGNVDATVLAQAPKLAPYLEQMRRNLAWRLQVPVDAVSVKATTEEGLGFTGTGDGIAAHAVCLVENLL